MPFPIHSCDPDNPCPVLVGKCEGRHWIPRLPKWAILNHVEPTFWIDQWHRNGR